MQQKLGDRALYGRLAVCFVSALGLAAACSDKSSSGGMPAATGGGIFGGSGGVIEATPLAGRGGAGGTGGTGTGGGSGGTTANACKGTPQGMLALIDNFNDDDNVAVYEPAREAYWFMIDDGSMGKLEPPKDFVSVPGGYHGSKSAHVLASGFSTWGAALVANISHKAELRCPYNASHFAGLRFVARGKGSVLVQLAMPAVIDKEYGGDCDPAEQTCYDQHSAPIELTDDYKVFELPWSSFQQRGFGPPVTFDPAQISTLYFSFQTKDLPIELWLDDVAWWDGVHVTETEGGAGGAGAGGAESSGAGAGGASSDAGGGGASAGGGD